MKLNLTIIYVGIMLPLTLGYMRHKKQKGEASGIFPLAFLIGLMLINYFKHDDFWNILFFRLRGLFM